MNELNENIEKLKSTDSFERLIGINWFKENPNPEVADLLKNIIKIEDNDIIRQNAQDVLDIITADFSNSIGDLNKLLTPTVSQEDKDITKFKDSFEKSDLKGKVDLLNRITAKKSKSLLPYLKEISIQSNSMVLNIAIQKTISFLENIKEKTTIITDKELGLNIFDIRENFDFIRDTLQDNFEFEKIEIFDLNSKGKKFLEKIQESDINRTKLFLREAVLNLNDDIILAKNTDNKPIVFIPLIFQNEVICLVCLTCFINTEVSGLHNKVIKDKIKMVLKTIAINKRAITDSLTKMYNRDFLLRVLEEKIKTAKNADVSKRNISIFIFDIDHFKSFNDTYGHLVGDEVLKHVAKITTNTCREYDSEIISARYGGEEFIVLYPENSYGTMYEVAEKLRKNIENFDTSIIKKTLNVKENIRKITVSIGIYAMEPQNFSRIESDLDVRKHIKNMIEKSDEAMYFSKNSGRNRTTKYKDIEKSHNVKEYFVSNKLQASLIISITIITILLFIIINLTSRKVEKQSSKIKYPQMSEFIVSISDLKSNLREYINNGDYKLAVEFIKKYIKRDPESMKSKIASMEMRKIEIKYLNSPANPFERVYIIFDDLKNNESENSYFRYKKIKQAIDMEALDNRSIVLIKFYTMKEYLKRNNYYLAYRSLMNLREKLSKNSTLIYFLGVSKEYFDKESDVLINRYNLFKEKYETELENRGEFDIFSFSQDELNQLGEIYRKALIDKFEDRKDESVEKFENILRRDPYLTDVYKNLLDIYKNENDTDILFEFLKKWETNIPNSDLPKLEIAKYYYELQDYDNVMKKLNEIKSFSPYSKLMSEVYYYTGLTYIGLKHPYKALQEFKKSLKLNPNQEKIKKLIKDME